jgi:hypothetical protein
MWREGKEISVETAVGRGLFDFGHIDGPAQQALLQHPQGLALDGDGNVIVADTFNGAIRRYSPSTGQVSTIVGHLQEPTDVLPTDSGLLVVESAANRVIQINTGTRVNDIYKDAPAPVKSAPITVAPNLKIRILLDLPEPMHVDESTESPIRVTITSTPASLLSDGIGVGYDLQRDLRLHESAAGTIHVSAKVAACDDTVGICTLMTQDWNLHVLVKSDGAPETDLILSGPPATSE